MERSRLKTVQLLRTNDDPFNRTTLNPGHVTASAVVLSPTRHVMLIRHEQLHRWFQPGGHVEPTDACVLDAARREVLEETGIRLTSSHAPLVGIDMHRIPHAHTEPEHMHFDLVFGFLISAARDNASIVPHVETTDGVSNVGWCRPEDMIGYNIDAPLRRNVIRTLVIMNNK